MTPARTRYFIFAVVALVMSWCGSPAAAAPMPAGKGRIYVFRMVRSYGAHLDDYLTIDGMPVQRISPGNGVYCDLAPGDHVLGLSHHKSYQLKVPVVAGQQQYACVMLQHRNGGSLRSGAMTSDQSFEIRLLDPNYGARRVQEYHLTEAKCR